MAELKLVASIPGVGPGAPRGPDGPMLDQRVARLEQFLERLEPKITEILLASAKQSDLQALRIELAELRGKVSMLPTWSMLLIAVIGTWAAGAGIVFQLIKVAHT